MTASFHVGRAVALCAAAGSLVLGGCKTTTAPVASASTEAPAASQGWAGREGVSKSIALLNQGKAAEARARLLKVLDYQPHDAIARRLLDQIEKDPKELLGAQHFSYTARSGDTYSSLAGKFLGDPMLFYALARYNGLATPGGQQSGKAILIPGKRPVSARKDAPRTTPKKTTAAAKAAPPAAVKPAGSSTDPARASKLRGMALAAMNGGAIDRAVILLRQAHAADPANPAVKADLGRALRVQSTVRSR